MSFEADRTYVEGVIEREGFDVRDHHIDEILELVDDEPNEAIADFLVVIGGINRHNWIQSAKPESDRIKPRRVSS